MAIDPRAIDPRASNPRASVETLLAAVAKLGYTVTEVAEGDDRTSPAERYSDEAIYQRRNVLLAPLITAPLVALAMLGNDSTWQRIAQAVLAAPVVFVFGFQFHSVAWKRLRSFDATMDTLISVGTLAAFGYSIRALFTDDPVLFETAAMIVTLILLGRFFEERAKGRASEAVAKLLELSAREARVIRNNTQAMVDPLDLRPGTGDHRQAQARREPRTMHTLPLRGHPEHIGARGQAGLLNPMIAAAATTFSSVSVVTNSLRLRRFDG